MTLHPQSPRLFAAAVSLVLMAASCGADSADMGPPVQITSGPGQETAPSVSPDGTIAYTSGGDIYVLEPGGEPVNLTPDTPSGDVQPAFSPSGTRLAFSSGRQGGGIFVMDASGGEPRQVTQGGFNPSWSPDEAQIVYTTGNSGPNPFAYAAVRMMIADVETGQGRQLGEVYGAHPRFSPGGQRVAFWSFAAADGAGQKDIWTIGSDGAGLTQVTDDAAVDWSPAWSPEGDHLYFASDRDGAMKIWRVGIDEDTGEPRGAAELVTRDAGFQMRGQIDISGDGTLAYVDRSVQATLYSRDFDPALPTAEEAAVPVAQISPLFYEPSPDRSQVVFLTGEGEQSDIHVINVDGTGLRSLTDDAWNEGNPVWLPPDGSMISFRSDRAGNWQQFLIPSGGGGIRQITEISDDYGHGGGIQWSPDGQRGTLVLVYRGETGGTRLLLVDPDGPDTVIRDAPNTTNVAWSPDSQQLVFRQAGETYLYDVETGTIEDIGDVDFIPTSWSADGILAGRRPNPAAPPTAMLYHFDRGEYEELGEQGIGAGPDWLEDGERMWAGLGPRVMLLDRTGAIADVLALAPGFTGVSLPSGAGPIFYMQIQIEADIYKLEP